MSGRALVFAVPGDIDTPTGGYRYDRRLIEELRAQGRELTTLVLGSSFPHPTPEDTADAAEKLAQVPEWCPVIIDGLALGALDPAAMSHLRAPLVALIHHPLAYESGLEPGRREELLITERENLRRAVHVIVPSPHTASLLTAHYGVDAARITIARPGTDRPRVDVQRADPPLILSVGGQVPRKGHDVLLEALHTIAHLRWQAVIAGPVGDLAYGATLHHMRDRLGLADRVLLAGPVSERELAELYGRATIFALATRFEGYGMVFDEAMAHGLPIVTCDAGAVLDTVAPGAGVLVPVDKPREFARALESVLEDADVRGALASASALGGLALGSWEDMAARVGELIDSLQVTDT